MSTNEEMDVAIDLRNLIYNVLKRWRLLIISMIIGGILLNGFGYLKSKKNSDAIRQTITDYQDKLASGTYDEKGNTLMSIPDFEKNLTERQINEVTNLVSTYKMYQGPYSNTVDYINNSLLMQIDPKSTPTYTIQYLIDTHYSVEYPIIEKKDYTKDIIYSIENILLTDDTYIEIASALTSDKETIDSSYIRELITLSSNSSTEIDSDTFTITVYGRTTPECETIIKIIKDKMPGVFKRLKLQYSDFDYSLLSENSYVAYNKNIQTMQQAKADELNNIYKTTQGMIQNLTDDQKSYFYALLNNKDTVSVELPVDTESSEVVIDPSTLEIPAIQKFSLKYSLIGIFAGLAIPCLFIIFITLFSGKIGNINEIETCFGISLLGIWRISSEPKGIFAIIDKLLIKLLDKKGEQDDSEEEFKRIITDISLSASKNKWNSIFIATTSTESSAAEAIKTLSDKLKNKIDTVAFGNTIYCKSDTLEKLISSDAIVLVEQSDVTKTSDVRKESNLCNRYKLPIIGYVILK